uniref:Terpene synthase N-terminal domain-containing protein n=1 Tax=Setaria viridis TaxID=4556 RepID=A0A4U6U3B1_SETVI|nr:hypothetical protein SEVIR_6G046100v2 [Setaria viridis]
MATPPARHSSKAEELRKATTFHPSLWGDFFLTYQPPTAPQDCRWWGCYTNPSTCLMTTTSLVAISRLAVLEAPSLRPHSNPSFCENFTPSLASGSGNYCYVLN